MTSAEIIFERLLLEVGPLFAKKIKEAIDEERDEAFRAHGGEDGITIAMAICGMGYDEPFDDVIDNVATDFFPLEAILSRRIELEVEQHRAAAFRDMIAGLDAVKAALNTRYADIYGKEAP